MGKPVTRKKVSILRAEPTVFVREDSAGFLQAIDLTLNNSGGSVECVPVLQTRGESHEAAPLRVPHGTSTQRILVPESRRKTTAVIKLKGGRSEAEVVLGPVRRWTVYLVQNAHFDPGYTDLPSNVMDEYLGFFDDVIRFCDETDHFPDEVRFRYQVEQAWQILHALERQPERTVARLVALMREGRIAVNAFYCNIISEICGSEELARLLYPSFSLTRKYGIPITTAEHNDIPGISWGMAQAMVSAGIRYFCPGLPDYFSWGPVQYPTFWDDKAIRPSGCVTAFRWRAPDGRSVLFYSHDQGAGGAADRRLSPLFPYLRSIEEKGYPYTSVRWFLNGAHRDNAPPCVEYAYAAREHNNTWSWPRLRIASNPEFFAHLETELGDEVPTFSGEFPGTDYPIGATSSARETGINRITHDRLPAAEAFAEIASRQARSRYPSALLNRAWRSVLRYDEHAFGLAYPLGACHEACASEKNNYAYLAAGLTEDVMIKALNKLADEVELINEGCHLVVFNSLAHERTGVVRIPAHPVEAGSRLMFTPPGDHDGNSIPVPISSSVIGRRLFVPPAELMLGDFDIIDAQTGNRVNHQVIELTDPESPVPHAPARFSHGQKARNRRLEIVMLAEDVPSLGYRAYRLTPRRSRRRLTHDLTVDAACLEGPFYRIKLDVETGSIVGLYDKELRRELWDDCSPWHVNELVGRSWITGEYSRCGKGTVEVGDSGPVSASVIIRGEGPGCPRWIREIRIYQSIRRIDFSNRILKDATPTQELYFAFPFAVEKPQFRYEGALSTIEPIRDQLPGTSTDAASVQHFAHVFNNRIGITWASREAPIASFSEIWPGYVSQAHHNVTPPGFVHPFLRDPSELTRGSIFSYAVNNNFTTNFHTTQSGDLLFRYSVTSHRGGWDRNARAARDFGFGVMNPLEAVYIRGPQSGPLLPVSSFLDFNAENVVLLALKRAEDGIGSIMRIQETMGRATTVRVGYRLSEIGSAYETNLVEMNERLLKFASHWVEAELRPWGVTTIRVIGRE